MAVHQCVFASKDWWVRGWLLSSGVHLVSVSRRNMLLEAAHPSGKLGRRDCNGTCLLPFILRDAGHPGDSRI